MVATRKFHNFDDWKVCFWGSHQLLEVVLHRVGINHHTNGHQRVKGKVEDLVAEEWNDPSCVLLVGRKQASDVVVCPAWMYWILLWGVLYIFTLYAPYVAMPHMRIMSKEIAVAMQMSAERRKPQQKSGQIIQFDYSKTGQQLIFVQHFWEYLLM